MGTALRDIPQISREVPSGVTQLDGDWYVPDFATSGGPRELQ
jgi:penicillin-binding protein 1A